MSAPATNPEVDALLVGSYGDPFPGFNLQFNPSPSGNLARVVMQWRYNLLDATEASVIATLTSDDITQIEITDAANWLAVVKEQDIALPIGDYFWLIWMLGSGGFGYNYGQGYQKILPMGVIVPP